MKKIYSIIFLLLFVTAVVNAADRYSVATGIWNATATWSATSGGAPGASVPVAGDNVFIEGGFTVTVSTNVGCTNLTVGTATAGTLTIGNDNTNRTVTISGNITIGSTGIFQSAGNGGNVLNIGGNLANSGTFDMNIGAADADVTFNGTANQTVSGTGGTTNFNVIAINNTGAANDNIVEVSSSNFTVAADFLTLTDGILKLSGSYTLSNAFFSAAGYNIVAAAGLWLNNANVTVSAQNGSPDIDGILRISNGTYNIGTSVNNSLNLDNGSSFTMEGGALNITGRFQPQSGGDTYTVSISGGTITLGTIQPNTGGNVVFQISNTGCTFIMSGGLIVFQNANAGTGGDYQNVATTSTITGGTINFGNSSTAAGTADDFDVIGASKFPSFVIVDNGTSVPTLTLGASGITATGGITINAGTSLVANSQSISLTGSWTNDGTFTPGTQTTTFNGAAAQTIGGTTATAFSSLTINNTTGGVSLSQDISVSGTMTFTNGVVTSTSTNTLTINDGAVVSGANNNSYVDGPMIKLGNDDFTFPVGDPLGSYHPLQLNNTAGANGDSYTVEYFRASATALGSVSSPLYGVSNCEYWTVARNAGSSTPNLFVSWTAQSPCPTPSTPYTNSLTGLTVARLNAGTWVLADGTDQAASGTIGVGGAGSVADNGINLVGTFALGNTAPDLNPLPVRIGSIKAYEKANGVQIDWTVFTEINVDKYIIERSADGQRFTPIGDVAAYNSPNESRYGFFDPSPLRGVSFYRLRNLDIDGRSDYSKIVRVDLDGKSGVINVYPNPARSGAFISYNGNLAKGNYTARIFNASGQQVWVQKFTHGGGAINQTIQLPASVRSGMHSLQLDNEESKVAVKSFMVQ